MFAIKKHNFKGKSFASALLWLFLRRLVSHLAGTLLLWVLKQAIDAHILTDAKIKFCYNYNVHHNFHFVFIHANYHACGNYTFFREHTQLGFFINLSTICLLSCLIISIRCCTMGHQQQKIRTEQHHAQNNASVSTSKVLQLSASDWAWAQFCQHCACPVERFWIWFSACSICCHWYFNHSLSLSLSLSPHHPLSPTLLLLDFLSSTFKTAYKVMTNSDTQWKGKEGWWPSFISIIPGRLSYFLNSTLEHWAWTNKQKTHTRRYHNVVILILKAPNKALFSKMTRLLVSTTDRSDESNPLLTNHLSVTHPQFSPRQSVSSFPYTTFPSAAGHDPRYTYLSAFVTGSKLLQFRLYSMTCIQTGIGTHASV